MKLYHQTGHNSSWNMESFLRDSVGEGMIFSPVNITKTALEQVTPYVRTSSFFDPQIYLPKDAKGHLGTYDYFPKTIDEDVNTANYDDIKFPSARQCVDFQVRNQFSHIVIPARYYDSLPSYYFQQVEESFIEPFTSIYRELGLTKPLLLTVIVKQVQIIDTEQRNTLLNWITGLSDIAGVYVIFENNFPTKQIQNSYYLAEVLKFIAALRFNDLEVHVGYTNLEGLLYSIVDPTSVALGSFENLRNFSISRFVSEKQRKSPPNPRLYVGSLLEWIDHGYIDAIRAQYDEWTEIVDPSPYMNDILKPNFPWNAQRGELYKHYFWTFNQQVISLPNSERGRISRLRVLVTDAMRRFDAIKNLRIILDENSNGSHLIHWLNAINTYEDNLKGN